MGDVLLKAEALEVGYRGQALLPPVSFELRPREIWALIGRNGSGKTTLIRTLLGLLPRVGGAARSAARIGYVPQRQIIDSSVPGRVLDRVAEGLDAGWSFLDPFLPRRRAQVVRRVLEELEIADLARAQFAELSEGQKQRVLMARALVGDPQIVILDEPTSAMDMVAEEAVFALLRRLQAQRQLAMVVVSHHLPVLAANATHALMVDREEQIALAGPLAGVLASDAFKGRYGDFAASVRGSAAESESHDPRE